jgi:NTP pyrophosphatase (non-canonical NTP hydrolase)
MTIQKQVNLQTLNTNMTKRIDFNKYQQFVDAVTSDASRDFLALTERLVELDEKGANIERLMTAGVGMCAETGEFLEVVKKVVYQGKEWSPEVRFHLLRELGDNLWYVMQAIIALDTSMEEVIQMNIDKLSARYPGGVFDSYYSENREEGDL